MASGVPLTAGSRQNTPLRACGCILRLLRMLQYSQPPLETARQPVAGRLPYMRPIFGPDVWVFSIAPSPLPRLSAKNAHFPCLTEPQSAKYSYGSRKETGAVLIRAVRPIEAAVETVRRRGVASIAHLNEGFGPQSSVFQISGRLNGLDLRRLSLFRSVEVRANLPWRSE